MEILKLAWRYGNPSIENGIKKLKENGTERLFWFLCFRNMQKQHQVHHLEKLKEY